MTTQILAAVNGNHPCDLVVYSVGAEGELTETGRYPMGNLKLITHEWIHRGRVIMIRERVLDSEPRTIQSKA